MNESPFIEAVKAELRTFNLYLSSLYGWVVKLLGCAVGKISISYSFNGLRRIASCVCIDRAHEISPPAPEMIVF